MLTPQEEGKKKRYLGIKSDALFHETVPEGTEGAVYREYEYKDKKTNTVIKGSKWEILSPKLPNVFIKDIRFEMSDFGENILTTVVDGDNEVTWSENTSTEFATYWMQALPNVDFSKKISFVPWSRVNDSGKTRRGITAYQADQKVENYFYDWDKREERFGFPKWSKKKEEMTKDDWIMHFLQVKMFLVDYTKKNIVPKFEGSVAPVKVGVGGFGYPTAESEGLDLNSTPF